MAEEFIVREAPASIPMLPALPVPVLDALIELPLESVTESEAVTLIAPPAPDPDVSVEI